MTNAASFFCCSVAVAAVAAAASGPVVERRIAVFGPFSSVKNR